MIIFKLNFILQDYHHPKYSTDSNVATSILMTIGSSGYVPGTGIFYDIRQGIYANLLLSVQQTQNSVGSPKLIFGLS